MLENFKEMKLGMKFVFMYYVLASVFALMGTATAMAYLEPRLLTGFVQGMPAIAINILVFGIWTILAYGIYSAKKWAEKGVLAWNAYGILFSLINLVMVIAIPDSLLNTVPADMKAELLAGATAAESAMILEFMKYSVIASDIIIILISGSILYYILKNKYYFRN
ncbi:hypothetical protein M2325_000195 [Methanococcus voltae PS]|uniref:DUF4199 domain-containing protein n=1 Tax=Methanococcus voltae PS TaxID=523842 RepID=A0ABT2EUC7_METVO|nr:hypothetical protein [Methanococcus voltae]MCS3921522.1 hypothetical protein [Methanococcus voltae PS]